MLYPVQMIDPVTAAATPTIIPSGTAAVMSIDMTATQALQILLTQLSLTEDFALRAWLSAFPVGISLIRPAPGQIAVPRVMPRPLVVFVDGQPQPPDSHYAPVQRGKYYLNVLNLTNSPTLLGFAQTILA